MSGVKWKVTKTPRGQVQSEAGGDGFSAAALDTSQVAPVEGAWVLSFCSLASTHPVYFRCFSIFSNVLLESARLWSPGFM